MDWLPAAAAPLLGASLLALVLWRRAKARSAPQTPHQPRQRRILPAHIAFIMDGNRRFGAKRFGPARRLEGHAAGGRKLGEVVDWCLRAGVAEVTAFAFSTENWHQDSAEVALLMRTFVDQCSEILKHAREKRVRCDVLCTDATRLPAAVRAALETLETETAFADAALTLHLAVSYGARGEIASAARKLAERVAAGEMDAGDVDEASLGAALALRSPPDLLVRTSGERRLSNFLLWQMAYTELVFLDKHWPELAEDDFDAVLDEYARRQRRYGK